MILFKYTNAHIFIILDYIVEIVKVWSSVE